MQVAHGGPAMLAVDEVIDHARLQRSGPKQRNQRDDVLEAVRQQAADQLLHAARFELEHRRGLATLQQRNTSGSSSGRLSIAIGGWP
jgi:hypothetical protein